MTEFAMNSAISSTSGFAPFELNYGYMPTLMRLPSKSETTFYGIEQFAEKARQNLSTAHDAIIASRIRQTTQANRNRREEPSYALGDQVYLSTKNLTLPKGRVKKLLPKFIGPYEIVKAHAKKSTYELRLPEELRRRKIHPVFHVSRLRPHVGNDDSLFPGREAKGFYDFGLDENTDWVVREIEDHKWTSSSRLKFLVVWELGDATWEPLSKCKDLEALDRYLEIKGVDNPEDLSEKRIASGNK